MDEELGAVLAAALRDATSGLPAPLLHLDSLSITSDGAFIAGFCDDRLGSFAHLRAVATATGQATLGGELTSRPKALIHVTLGRLLGAPEGTTDEQRACFARVVRRYNRAVLPALVSRSAHTSLRLATLSLARDRVWWMTEYELLDTWELQGPSIETQIPPAGGEGASNDKCVSL